MENDTYSEKLDIIAEIFENGIDDIVLNNIENDKGEILIYIEKDGKLLYGEKRSDIVNKMNDNWKNDRIEKPVDDNVRDSLVMTLLLEADYYFTLKLLECKKDVLIDLDKFNKKNKPKANSVCITYNTYVDKDGDKVIAMVKRKNVIYACKLKEVVDINSTLNDEIIYSAFYDKVKDYYRDSIFK